MPLWAELLAAVLAGPFLWLAGAVFFDFVHWALHCMLRSRWRLLRRLAWPHGVHHAWIDRELRVRWENQRRNVLCHIVPEYLTQLAFSAALSWILPLSFVAVLVLLQTAAFVGILRAGGLDYNHRPIERLDAYRPGFHTPPAYHALHHVYPDAYFSAYTKAVDVLVGGCAQLAGRRFALVGVPTAFGVALGERLVASGAELMARPSRDDLDCAELDVLLLCDLHLSRVEAVEAFVRATRTRKLPPEVWAVHERAGDPTARYYHRDVRVSYRTLVLPDPGDADPERARRRARIAVGFIRRGFHLVPTELGWAAWRDRRRFRATAPVPPTPAPRVRSRLELA